MRSLEPSWSLRASLPPLAVLGLACAQLIGSCVATGCQPRAPAATPGAGHFEIPVAGRPEVNTAGTVPVQTGTTPPPAPGLPEQLPTRYARQHACAQDSCSLAGWLPDPSWAESPLEEVAAQAAIWVHVFGPRAKLTLPPNAALELVVVCLSGELGVRDTLAPPGATPPPLRLSPWLALRASGAGTELECGGRECSAMLALIAPNSTLASAVRAVPTAGPRVIPLEVRAFQDSAVAASNHGKNHARVLFGGDATKPPVPFSLTLLQIDAPAQIAPHSHDGSWENLLVLEGQGDLDLRGRSYPLAGGESLHIAPGVRHGYVSRGQTRFVALQLYTPAGPEQRFLAPTAETPAAAAADARVPPEPP